MAWHSKPDMTMYCLFFYHLLFPFSLCLALIFASTDLLKVIDLHNGIYIHIPFCRRRCHYCDFPIEVIGERKSTIQTETRNYVNVLLNDIHTTFNINSISAGKSQTKVLPITSNQSYAQNEQKISSIYFGGGTPSLLDSTSNTVNYLTISIE
jgi:coproporphyrinogen III oxidase-like Fe-S oxidoreductase